jgi:hypothetical protein
MTAGAPLAYEILGAIGGRGAGGVFGAGGDGGEW